jgi:3D (Asp-Asp-Asp) domain-containing protein
VIAGLLIVSIANAQDNINTSDTNTTTKILLTKNNPGLACGIAKKAFIDASYIEPEPEKFTINASAYTAAADECGKSDGITASGNKVKQDHTIACPREYAFGTKIHIEGMGTYTCEDRGGAIKGNKFDIYMETKSEAFAFGRRNLVAYVTS